MQNLNSSDNKILTSGEISKKECECDNAWQLTSLSEEELQKWETEKARYYEICEYFKEVNDILDLIRPYPRDKGISENGGGQIQVLVKSDVKDDNSEPGINNLENIIKLVEKLKELQEKSYRQRGRSYFGRDLKKLREHKRKLKSEKLKQIINEESKKQFLSDLPTELEEEFSELSGPKNKSGSEDFSCQENWKEREKSECLPHDLAENKSKISKWTKVKEAFHWEKAIHPSTSKPNKKLKSFQERDPKREYYDDHLPVQVWVFDDDNCLPTPPPPPPPPPLQHLRSLSSSKNDDYLLAPPLQDFPSSSSSDRLDDFVFTDSSKKGSKSPDADSSGQFFPTDDNDDCGIGTRKSSSEEFITQISQKLSKDEFASSLSKSNKTTWGKVKDIIQTRRESLKKRPKKKLSGDFNQRRKLSSPPAIHFSHQIEDLSSAEEKLKSSEEIAYSKTAQEPSAEIITVSNDECTKKPMPLLTITLPSSDETKPLSWEALERRITKEDEKPNVLTGFSCQAQYCEEKPKYIKNKSAQNQKLSRWVKVKRVFLTSSSPPRTFLDELGVESSPTGLHKFGFLSDLESDDLSSGEWNDENLSNEKTKMAEHQMPLSLLQDDIKKSYQELQKKLSQEFDQKIREWDTKNEIIAKTDDLLHKTFSDDKIAGPRFKRNSGVPLPSINDLSPEFRKKLNDWKKIKSTQGSICTSPTKEDVQGPNSRIRIGEWQPWKSRYSVKHIGKCDQSSFEEFKKPEVKTNNLCPSLKQAKEDGNTALRELRGKEHVKKTNYGRSGSEATVSWNPNEEKYCKRVAKVKDFQWVEKELQKIVREKIRLEQEREKYLQREARLKQMKRTMGPALPAQEILVKTPTGLIRFKGISQKFTKKLYEWEKARGIAPEASTFALLEERAITSTNNASDGDMILQRSKSMGSIADLSTALLVPGVTHYPSSLSLNDVDELKTLDEADVLDESLSSDHFRIDSDKQPEALLVEVEDVVEEAEIETDFPVIKSEIPKYTFASEQFNQLASPNDGQSPPVYCDAIQSKSAESTKRILKPAERKISSTRENMDKVVEWMEQMNKTSEVHKTITQQNSSNNDVPSISEANVENDNVKEKAIKNFENNESVILHTTPVVFPVLENTTDNTKTKNNIKRTEGILSKKGNSVGAIEKEKIEKVSKNQSKSDPETIKQKIKEKITLMQRMSTDVSFNNKWKHECNREILDEKAGSKKNELSESFDRSNSKLLSNEQKSMGAENSAHINSVNVLVPTIRKIYSPIKTNQGLSPVACSYVVDDIQTPEASSSSKCSISENDKSCKGNCNQIVIINDEPEKLNIPSAKENLLIPENQESNKFATESESTSLVIGIPPLPKAPKLYKKQNTKETAPSIKMIIDKYNQKISEKEWTNEGKNDGGTVIGWRSPVFGRRTIEKVQKSFKEGDAFERNNEVQKSVSFDAVKSIPLSSSPEISCPDNSQDKKIFKSNSVGVIKIPSQTKDSNCEDLKKSAEPEENLEGSFTTLRALKIKKAKEDFLSGRLSVSSDASSTPSVSIKYSPDVAPNKPNKLSTSVDTSTDNILMKSISAETITSEQNPSQSDDQSFSGKNLQKSSSKFDLCSIKAKFRRMRWRRDKDSKLNSVAALCRQSLLIEIPSSSQSNLPSYNLSKSCPSSPVMTRNKQNGDKESSKKKEK